ncbi:DUF2878 domain-containing protein [bacterium]|nr:DUF2878 domain-containing protein [bacterium]
MKNKHSKILVAWNAVGFNLAWWGCIFGVKWQMPYLGPVLMLLFLLIHFKTIGRGKREILFVMLAGLLGTVVDSLKATTGLVGYAGGYGSLYWLAPLWITAMWTGFAALLHHSLGWLKGRLLVAFIMGAVFGPLSYLTGIKFEVLQFGQGKTLSIFILAVVWGLAIPFLYFLSERMNVRGQHV